MVFSFNEGVAGSPPSEIRRYFELAQRKADVINFGVGEPCFATPSVIREAAKRAIDEGFTHYSSNMGFPDLRDAIRAKLGAKNGINVPVEGILVTHGAAQALFAALFTLVNPGDEVIILEPAFNLYASVVRFCGGVPVAVPLDMVRGFRMDKDRLGRAVSTRTRGIILNTPHNPSGAVLDRGDAEGIAELALRRDLWVMSDEVYETIVYDGRAHLSIGSLPGMEERTITVNSFSKAFAMTGWRVGYMAAPAAVAAQVLKVHQNSIACANTIAQRAALAALRNAAALEEEARAAYTRLRNVFSECITAIPGVTYHAPQGTFYALIGLEDTGDSLDSFALDLLERRGIVVVPGTAFGASYGGLLRFSFCIPEEGIREGLSRFGLELAARARGGL